MITGLMVLDCDDNIIFKPNQFMLNRIMGHAPLIEEISAKSVVLYGKSSFDYIYNEHPIHHDSSTVYVGDDLEKVEAAHPFTSVVIIGNKTIIKYLDRIDQLMIIKYKSKGLNPEENEKFILPPQKPLSIAMLINYDIYTYRLHR